MTSNNYLTGQVFKTYLAAGFLSAAAMLLGPLVIRILVGNFLTSEDLAAVNIVEPIQRILNALVALFESGAIVLASYDLSRVDDKSASKVFSFSLFSCIIIGLILTLATPICHNWIANSLCDNVELLLSVKTYSDILLYSSPVLMALPVMTSFISLDGSPKYSYVTILISQTVSIVLAVALIASGNASIAGIAFANLAGNVVGCVMGFHYFLRKSYHFRFSLRGIDRKRTTEILKMGIPGTLSPLLDAILVFVANAKVLELYGTDGADVMAVCLSMVYIFALIITGFSMTLRPYGSYLTGMEDIAGYGRWFRKNILIQEAVIATVLVPLMLFPETVMAIFGVSSSSALVLGKVAFPIFVMHFFLCGITELYTTNFLVLKKTRYCLAIGLSQTLFRILFVILFAKLASALFWWSYPLGIGAGILVLMICLLVPKIMGQETSLLTGASFIESQSCASFSVQCTVADLKVKLSPICEYIQRLPIPELARSRAEHCVEEVLLNTVLFADMRHKESHSTDIKIIEKEQSLTIIFYDDGVRYNPFDNIVPEVDMGLEIIKKMCPDISYTYLFQQNIINITLPFQS